MDRQIVYPGAIPLETDILNTNRNVLIALGFAMQAILGTSTVVDGLACTPTSPASMQVNVGNGSIYSLQNLDATAYSSLAADTTDNIVKQGISLATQTFNAPAPATAGQSVVYLIEAAYQDTDTGSVTLPYYNASNPSTAYSGPNNSGAAQNTVRKGAITVQIKAGVAATTGTQAAPAVDAGFVALYTVTVAYGQTSIVAGNIATASGAPIIGTKLPSISALAALSIGLGLQSSGGTLALKLADGSMGVGAGGAQTLSPITSPASGTTLDATYNGKTISPPAAASYTLAKASTLATNGLWFEINATQYAVTLTPNAADSINGGTAGAAVTIPVGGFGICATDGASKWSVLIGTSQAAYGPLMPIAAAVASNALTITMNPATLSFRSATLSSGAVSNVTINAALTLTVPSGATLGTVAGTQAQLAVVALNNAGTVQLGIVNISGGLNLDETTLVSTTAISSGSTANNVIYSSTALTNVPFRVLGYILATEATAGTWATAPSLVQGVGGQAFAAMQSLGFGQTWQSVTGSRAASTTYYNTTGRPILVSITSAHGTANTYTQMTINGVVVLGFGDMGSASAYGSYCWLIPPGASYSAAASSGTLLINVWNELR